MNWKKIAMIAGSIMAVFSLVGYLGGAGISAYSMLRDIHSQYATKTQVRSTYFQTRVDDMSADIDDLKSTRVFFETKLKIEGNLLDGETMTLNQTILELGAMEKMRLDFQQSIRELTN